MKRLAIVAEKLEAGLCFGAGGFMILLLLMVFAEVISRYVFEISHDFVADLSTWLMIWMTYLIVASVLKSRQHMSVDILPTRLPAKYRILLLFIADALSLIFGILLCLAGIQNVLLIRAIGIFSSTTLDIPMWTVRVCVPLGGILLSLFSIKNLNMDISSISKLRKES